jgi:hypothetical protein
MSPLSVNLKLMVGFTFNVSSYCLGWSLFYVKFYAVDNKINIKQTVISESIITKQCTQPSQKFFALFPYYDAGSHLTEQVHFTAFQQNTTFRSYEFLLLLRNPEQFS